MTNSPLVSIITITYNRCELIHRCIESIQKQTYQNYEHIIIDGNSPDKTEEVVLSYKDPHIVYKRLDTRGPEVQMKAGSQIAKGKYITFLDDDDEYLPEKIEKQVNFFEGLSADFGLIYCWMSYYDFKTGKKKLDHCYTLRGDCADISVEMPRVCGTPTLMVRKNVLDQVGGTYDDSIGVIGADWELAARICQITKVDYIPESLVRVYVNHSHARLSTDFYSDKAHKGIIFHNHFLTHFKSNFDRVPKYAKYHYYQLAKCYVILNDKKMARKYLFMYFRISPLYNPGISRKDILKTIWKLIKM